jgi:catechol 2,3-dioxygenase-like lactoylglutathione lyase family enzyme
VLLHHVQVSMPRGGEDLARRFYRDGLGLVEIDKPPPLDQRGGCWFQVLDAGVEVAQLHVGVEELFVPAARAHPGLLVGSVTDLEAAARRIVDLGFELSWEERDTLSGFVRFHARDGAGNRVEVLARA